MQYNKCNIYRTHANTPIRIAVDSILNEFCKYDEEKQLWKDEKNALHLQISHLKKSMHELTKEHGMLLKRHKLLKLSIERPFLADDIKSNKEDSPSNKNGKRIPFIDRLPSTSASRYIRSRASTLSATLPSKLDGKKMRALFDNRKSWLSNLPIIMNVVSNNTPKKPSPKLTTDKDSPFSISEIGKKKKRYPPLKPMSTENSSPTKNMNNSGLRSTKDIIANDRRPKFTGKNAKFNNRNRASTQTNTTANEMKSDVKPKNGTAVKKQPLTNINSNRRKVSNKSILSDRDSEESDFELKLSPALILKNHLSAVRCLCMSDDENTLISGSDDGLLKIWDLQRISSYMHTVNSQQFQQQQSQRKRTLRTPCPVTFRGHSSAIISCKVIPNSNIAVSAGVDGTVYGWKLPTVSSILLDIASLNSVVQFKMDKHTDVVWDIECNLNQWNVISSVSSDNTLKIFNIENQKITCDFSFPETFLCPTALLSLPENGLLCIGNVLGDIVLFDIKSNSIIKRMVSDGGFCVNRIVSGEMSSHNIFVACDDSNARVYNMQMMKCTNVVKVHTDSVTSLVMNEKSNSLLTVSHDSQLRIWDYRSFSCIQHLEPQNTHTQKWNEGILDIAINNNYKWAFSAGADGSIRLYRTNL